MSGTAEIGGDSRSGPREPRPGAICRQLLLALRASEGRRRRRKRDTRPDAIGLSIKRRLLEDAARADPDPADFERWLTERSLSWREAADAPELRDHPSGAVRAMAMEVLAEWRHALASPSFREWLWADAPSADADEAGEDGGGASGMASRDKAG